MAASSVAAPSPGISACARSSARSKSCPTTICAAATASSSRCVPRTWSSPRRGPKETTSGRRAAIRRCSSGSSSTSSCRAAAAPWSRDAIDRAPIFIIGATGPMDETKRRPRIDWIHTAQGQGEAVRAYTKWDYQPHTIAGVPEAFARAYAVMMSEPKGPIYMCYDAWLQERKLDHEVPLPPPHAAKVPSRIAPDPKALAAAADLIASAKKPVIIAEFVGRDPEGFHALVELAETGGLPVYDVDSRLNFPTRHPLNMS